MRIQVCDAVTALAFGAHFLAFWMGQQRQALCQIEHLCRSQGHEKCLVLCRLVIRVVCICPLDVWRLVQPCPTQRRCAVYSRPSPWVRIDGFSLIFTYQTKCWFSLVS